MSAKQQLENLIRDFQQKRPLRAGSLTLQLTATSSILAAETSGWAA